MHGLLSSYRRSLPARSFLFGACAIPGAAEEFKQYKLLNWPRDFLAILRPPAAIFGGLMMAEVFTHLRVKNPPFKVLLAATLLVCSLASAYLNYSLNFLM